MHHHHRPASWLLGAALGVALTAGLTTAQTRPGHPAGAATPTAKAPATPKSAASPRFGDLYVYGMIVLMPGGGTITYAGSRPPVTRPVRETPAPPGAVVTTGPDETARLRFECGSFVDLGPGSRVRIRAWSLELQQGACLVRHVGSPFPLKLGGVATLTMRQDSVLEAARDGEVVKVRVQAGRVRAPGLPAEAVAGTCLEASGETTKVSLAGPPLITWRSPVPGAAPAAEPVADGTGTPDPFDPSDGLSGDPTPTATVAPPDADDAGSPLDMQNTLEGKQLDPGDED
ncbi:MAG: FecR domain-containing protein [Candidatus Riflebacteria bacterium]|nr:FecR domain-containing protein [Candidatus Riflebacteria bacterium]